MLQDTKICALVSATHKLLFTFLHLDLLSYLRHSLRFTPSSQRGCSQFPLKTPGSFEHLRELRFLKATIPNPTLIRDPD